LGHYLRISLGSIDVRVYIILVGGVTHPDVRSNPAQKLGHSAALIWDVGVALT